MIENSKNDNYLHIDHHRTSTELHDMHQQIINQLFVGDTVMHPMQVCCITSGGLAHGDTGKFPGGSQSDGPSL